MTGYVVYDVFTDRAFGGNQLAVLPDAADIPDAVLQKIAREFNFSETVFVYPPDTPGTDARVRIFTPTMEVPFAGHPTIGTAVALADLGIAGPDMVLELGIGPIAARAEGGQASFVATTPLETLAHPDPALVAACLSLDAGDIDHTAHPPIMASVGLAFTITRLTSRAALARCQPVTDAFRTGAKAYPAGLDFAQLAYVVDGDVLHARMFAPLDNIPEDPATGSAAAALGALLRDLTGKSQSFTVHQGDDMGRPSRIGVVADQTGVTISGSAVRTMQGTLTY